MGLSPRIHTLVAERTRPSASPKPFSPLKAFSTTSAFFLCTDKRAWIYAAGSYKGTQCQGRLESGEREELTTASGLAPGSALADVAAAATPSTAANPDFLTCASNVSRSGFNPSGIRARSSQIRARSTQDGNELDGRRKRRDAPTFVSVGVEHLLEFFLEKGHVVGDQGSIASSHQLSRNTTC